LARTVENKRRADSRRGGLLLFDRFDLIRLDRPGRNAPLAASVGFLCASRNEGRSLH